MKISDGGIYAQSTLSLTTFDGSPRPETRQCISPPSSATAGFRCWGPLGVPNKMLTAHLIHCSSLDTVHHGLRRMWQNWRCSHVRATTALCRSVVGNGTDESETVIGARVGAMWFPASRSIVQAAIGAATRAARLRRWTEYVLYVRAPLQVTGHTTPP